LHPNQNLIDYRKTLFEGTTDRKEMEANKFAAELLMPECDFIRVWSERDGNAVRVANYFGVSKPAAEFRAKNLALA